MEKFIKEILSRYRNPEKWQWPDNWGLKLLSLLFAIFLWYFVVGEDRVDLKVFVPVEILNLPSNLVISNEYKKQLEVTIRGPRVLTRGIEQQHISRSVDLSKATPGKFVFTNEPETIPFPRGITVLRIQPQNVTLLLDRLVQKELPIKPVLVGKPHEGVEIANVILDPVTISISGPQAVLGEETSLSTDPIDISNIQTSTEKDITLDLKPAIAELIGDPVVTAKLIIKEKMVEQELAKIPIEFTHNAERTTYKLTPQTITVRAEVPLSLSKDPEALKAQFQVRVNAEGLPPGRHLLNVEVTPPKQVRILEITPKSVTLKISDTNPPKKIKPRNTQ